MVPLERDAVPRNSVCPDTGSTGGACCDDYWMRKQGIKREWLKKNGEGYEQKQKEFFVGYKKIQGKRLRWDMNVWTKDE